MSPVPPVSDPLSSAFYHIITWMAPFQDNWNKADDEEYDHDHEHRVEQRHTHHRLHY